MIYSCKICGLRVEYNEFDRWTGNICPDCRRAAFVHKIKINEHEA